MTENMEMFVCLSVRVSLCSSVCLSTSQLDYLYFFTSIFLSADLPGQNFPNFYTIFEVRRYLFLFSLKFMVIFSQGAPPPSTNTQESKCRTTALRFSFLRWWRWRAWFQYIERKSLNYCRMVLINQIFLLVYYFWNNASSHVLMDKILFICD